MGSIKISMIPEFIADIGLGVAFVAYLDFHHLKENKALLCSAAPSGCFAYKHSTEQHSSSSFFLDFTFALLELKRRCPSYGSAAPTGGGDQGHWGAASEIS